MSIGEDSPEFRNNVFEMLINKKETLFQELRENQRTISALKSLQDEIINQLNINKKELKRYCQHDWKMDPPQYQTRTSYTCMKCFNTK